MRFCLLLYQKGNFIHQYKENPMVAMIRTGSSIIQVNTSESNLYNRINIISIVYRL